MEPQTENAGSPIQPPNKHIVEGEFPRGGIRVSVDIDLCIGCGLASEHSPRVFGLKESGVNDVKTVHDDGTVEPGRPISLVKIEEANPFRFAVAPPQANPGRPAVWAEVRPEDLPDVLEAAVDCPCESIHVTDSEFNEFEVSAVRENGRTAKVVSYVGKRAGMIELGSDGIGISIA